MIAALLAALLLNCHKAAHAVERELVVLSGWTSHGPGAGGVTGLAADGQRPGVVYAASSDSDSRVRLFVSSDAGKSWTEVTDRPMLDPIQGPGLVADPQRAGVVYSRRGICYGSLCYCCVGELRRTLDAGATWEDLPGLPASVSSVAVDPFDSELSTGCSATIGSCLPRARFRSPAAAGTAGSRGKTWPDWPRRRPASCRIRRRRRGSMCPIRRPASS